MLLIIEPAGQRRQRSDAEGRAMYQQMLDFASDLKSRGLLIATESLRDMTGAARLQVRDGRRNLVDGPFAEAKEMVGGFFLLDCDDRAQAIAIAAECPAAQWATVEIRELGPCYT